MRFVVVQVSILLRNFWRFAVACCLFGCVERMVMSSAYVISSNGWGGCGMSEIKMLKSSGERTAPWGTPFCKLYCLLNVVDFCLSCSACKKVCNPAFKVVMDGGCCEFGWEEMDWDGVECFVEVECGCYCSCGWFFG